MRGGGRFLVPTLRVNFWSRKSDCQRCVEIIAGAKLAFEAAALVKLS